MDDSKIWEQESLARAGEALAELGQLPLGHYHSPFPSDADVSRAACAMESPPDTLLGIDLDPDRQLRLLDGLAPFLRETHLPRTLDPAWRFHNDNYFFGYGDADALHAMIRYLKPRQVIEIGSGFSSALTLDTNERFFDWRIDCTFIEPEPERMLELLHPGDLDRISVRQQLVQDVPLSLFESLAADDILFVDSSHVVKAGGDVNHEIFQILPRLAPGVHIHFHDVFYPFEYPRDWVMEGRVWSESYLLRAFLQDNTSFEITLFADYLLLFHPDAVRQTVPSMFDCRPGSVWLRRSA
jgi:hypothetical protein